jgi:outer membrane protein OmpA-like peptidoglycan-associated protein
MFKKLLVISTFLALSTSPAFAGGGAEGDIEVGPYVGWEFFNFSDYAGADPDNNLLYGARLGYFVTDTVSFEPSYQMLFTEIGAGTGMRIDSVRFNLLYNFMPEKVFRPFLTLGLGWEHTNVYRTAKSDDLGVNAGLGFRYFFADWVAARVDGRLVYVNLGSPVNQRQYNVEATGGISFFFGTKAAKDGDGDGVPDKTDKCPETPKGASVNAEGCPSDADGDGIYDGIDQCADTLKGAKVDAKGCPLDGDGDGIPDGLDQCPDTAKDVKVDDRGCANDADADGVTDNLDKCPGTPKGATVNAEGCPLDADADGVADYLDQCPNTEKGKQVDAKGCPLVTKARGVLKGVNFKFGSAELAATSFKVLDETAAALNEFPEVKVEVQGHTDSTGPAEANTKLSQARAQAVMDYLVGKGVDAKRLTAKGYGPDKPIADNKTKVGRAKNRRVELNWLD